LNIRVNPQRRSVNVILLLFIEPYNSGPRDSEKYINPDITIVSVTVNGSRNRVYNNRIEGKDIWGEICRFFSNQKGKSNMTLTKFYTDNKFGLLIDLRSMEDNTMQGSGTLLVNNKDSVHLEIERKAYGSGNLNSYIYTIGDTQMNIMDRQLQSVQY